MATIYKKGNKARLVVEEGFNWWACMFPTLWLLFHGSWLWLLLSLLISFVSKVSTYASALLWIQIVPITFMVYIGFKANTLVSKRLLKEGYVFVKKTKTSTKIKWLNAISAIILGVLLQWSLAFS